MEALSQSEARKSSDRYIKYVRGLREMRADGMRFLVSYYQEIKKGLDDGTWREGPYQSKERFLHIELGIHPQRWAHWEQAVDRFGTDFVSLLGFEASTPILRTKPKSKEETAIIQTVKAMQKERGGMAPSSEAVTRLVEKYVPMQRRVDQTETEEERLRKKVHALEGRLTTLKKKLDEANRCIKKLGGDPIEFRDK